MQVSFSFDYFQFLWRLNNSLSISYIDNLFALLRCCLDLPKQEVTRQCSPHAWLELKNITRNSFRKFLYEEYQYYLTTGH